MTRILVYLSNLVWMLADALVLVFVCLLVSWAPF